MLSGCSETSAKEYRVRHVVDGDTIELSGGEKVRYIGIDTPETMKRTVAGWMPAFEPWGAEAKEFNRSLVAGKKVVLEFDVDKRDKYGRLLAYVYVDDVMVNLMLVAEGLAKVYTFPPNVKCYDQFLSAQKQAQDEGRGMWGTK
ncbi:MAG: thermonuclease family protein [Candidatus Tantalella remota]|nr:thermonuclease family protein [Candidatus Tantalella remota]